MNRYTDSSQPGWLTTFLHLLQWHHLKESLQLAPQVSLRNDILTGSQTAVTAILAITLVHFSEWPHMVGFAGLGALIPLFGRFESRRRRPFILAQVAACQIGAVTLMSTAAWLGAPELLQLLLLALLCGLLLFITVSQNFGPPGALIFVFAAGASVVPELSSEQVIERTLATLFGASLAWCMCFMTAFLRHVPGPGRAFPQHPPVPPLSHRIMASGRIILGCGVAICLARYALGAHFPAWAGMGALAVMQGNFLHINMHRALQRLVGTSAGAGIAWLVLQQSPDIWQLLAVIAVCQVLTELVIGRNYALGQMFVAPMALLMTSLAAPHLDSVGMVPERILDTLMGAGVGMLVAVLLSTLDDRRHLLSLHQSAKSQTSHNNDDKQPE